MPKKRRIETNLSRLIKGMGLNLSGFARVIGVSASTIKKAAEGKRPMSQELCSRIFAETGVRFDNVEPNQEPLEYSKEDHRKFKADTEQNETGAKIAAGFVAKQVELLFLAASRPGVGKVMPLFTACNLALAKIKDEYHLEKGVDAVLRERHSTDTRLYTVKELRANDLLAKQVEFQDSPKYQDTDTIPLTKSVGWLPAKDYYNIEWQNRELIAELLKSKNDEMTVEQESQLKAMQKQMDREIDAFMPGFKSLEDNAT
jgi:transcriptional regulator with XRE-family HTH domain